MRIGQAASVTGVPVKTLRYWEEAGVLTPPGRDESGYRRYAQKAIDQVNFIRSAQAVGLSLEVIGEIIRLRSKGVTPCRHVEELLRERLADIDSKMESLSRARSEVSTLLERAATLDPQQCDDRSICHLLVTRQPPT